MYYVTKTIEVSGCHALSLSYQSKCEALHGHNWIITAHCKAEQLNADGMVTDFTHIKERVMDRLDHANVGDVIGCNPTAENIARWVAEQIPHCYKCSVKESRDNLATYTTPDYQPGDL